MLTNTELEVAEVIVEGLDLDVDPQKIDNNAPLFGSGLNLDSIDALELALLLTKSFGVKITQGDEKNEETFSSLSALSRFVQENRQI
ncbi:hypothetical protein L861_17220 [Litchfieldella anticariensis FP35 = DSM 16096]|uniref:Carrier domain-containing protein n=1 Tax=Litchfieldella anticariensis (strain DSM 16096 / CECT 5854 / CIP 108499 / LMG 22089 / FP35) TaxID=1121939 RepID=S2KRZ9_LITA3|nr:phosphopantetheine-binding protein [Halomonas anticariensis]EPC03283.1 hypothetical protein L861_17220 [Halomonas anticariensis FP35 = DSM 16096]